MNEVVKKDHLALPSGKFSMFILLISNHMVFSFNLELICACKFFKKLKFQLFEKLTGANYINSKLDEKKPYIGVINKV